MSVWDMSGGYCPKMTTGGGKAQFEKFQGMHERHLTRFFYNPTKNEKKIQKNP